MISAQFGILTRWQYSHNTTNTSQCRPLGVFAVHIIKPDDTEEINYIHKDHLGSWNTITDESGSRIQELSFDAWGNRRDPATWRAFAGTPPEPLFDRGFTGHEHLYAFNLINMNGRVYDPIVSRMLSPDNFIQAPGFSQSLNRYSYCWNNPLKYTDPTGQELGVENNRKFFWWVHRGDSYSSQSISPGSGNHWSDQYRGEYGNYMLGNRASFNRIYGDGAFALALKVVADKDALSNWSRGTSSLTEGMWVNIPNKNIEGTFKWFGTESERNELTSYEVINKFVKFGMDLRQDGGGINPAITGSISTGGGILGALKDSYKFGNYTVKYAERINGKVRNAKVLTRANQMNATKMASGLKVVGRGVTVLSVAASGYQFLNSDMSGDDYARLSGSLIITGTAFIPIVGPIISIGLGVADSYGTFDGIYNYYE
jgi:RHS repeat-associated protein